MLIVASGITFYLIYAHIKHAVVNQHNTQFVKAFHKEQKSEAFGLLRKTLKAAPDNIMLNKHQVLVLTQKTLQIDINHEQSRLLKFRKIEKDTLELSKKYLKKILQSNPYDDEIHHNLGWVYFALKQRDSAEIGFKKALELQPYNSAYWVSKILFDLKYVNDGNIKGHLTKAIRYSPEILESIFYREFQIKYPKIENQAKKDAVKELKKILENNNNSILKARLARLLLEENPEESYKLLKEVTVSLPNLIRPWSYLAYLEEKDDMAKAIKYYEKAIFLTHVDYLPNFYYAKFNKKNKKLEKSVKFYKEALKGYGFLATDNYVKNGVHSNLRTIPNSYIPNDLLYYLAPTIPCQEIFTYFIDYYGNLGDSRTMEFYQELSEEYNNRNYKGKEELR